MDRVALDNELFEKLYLDFHPRVLALCRRMLESHEEAQDAANDIFLRLPDAMRTYDRAQPFARWILRVTGNYCIDLLRKRRAAGRIIEPANPDAPEPPAATPSPFEALLSQERSGEVRDAIFALPEHYLVPLVMRYFSDLSYDEIAETLGTSRAHVAVLIFRAKQQLRRILASGGPARNRLRNGSRASAPPQWAWAAAPVFGLPF
jgi:RNA polymerase sigma-70 factor, ECF subfamily